MNKNDLRPIYNGREKSFVKYTDDLATASILEPNKTFLKRFDIYLSARGISKIRRGKLLYQSVRICKIMEKMYSGTLFASLDRDILLAMVSHINDLPHLSSATKADYNRCIKQMFKWYNIEDNRITSDKREEREQARKFYETLKSDVKSSYKRAEADPTQIITEADIKTLTDNHCVNPKERAFISSLHETGCRAAEFLNIKLGNIEVKEGYVSIRVPDGKTGARFAHVRSFSRHLIAHIENHPNKNNPNAFLWLSDATNSRGTPLMHRGSQKMINRVFERAKLDKKHNLHWFRHSRATILAPVLTAPVLCKTMGWTIGSDMIKVYAHLCADDVESAFQRMHGIAPQTKDTKNKECDCCHFVNPLSANYCGRCNKPMSLAVVIIDQQTIKTETDDTLKKMMEMFSNPRMLAEYQAFLQSKIK